MGCPAQTVPSSINLFKNSFVYHAVEGVPPDFEECNKFLGACLAKGGWALVRKPAHVPHLGCSTCRARLADLHGCRFGADSVRQAGAKVLVHCMSGYSR